LKIYQILIQLINKKSPNQRNYGQIAYNKDNV